MLLEHGQQADLVGACSDLEREVSAFEVLVDRVSVLARWSDAHERSERPVTHRDDVAVDLIEPVAQHALVVGLMLAQLKGVHLVTRPVDVLAVAGVSFEDDGSMR